MDVYAANHCTCSGEVRPHSLKVRPHSLKVGCRTQTHHPDASANHGNTLLHPTLREGCKTGEMNHYLEVPVSHHCL